MVCLSHVHPAVGCEVIIGLQRAQSGCKNKDRDDYIDCSISAVLMLVLFVQSAFCCIAIGRLAARSIEQRVPYGQLPLQFSLYFQY